MQRQVQWLNYSEGIVPAFSNSLLTCMSRSYLSLRDGQPCPPPSG